MQYKSIFISDLHLGSKYAQADKFLELLREVESENLFLIGDIVDGWAMKRKIRWKQSHSDVVQKLLRKSRKGTNVYYITGNHDDFLRPFVPLVIGDRTLVMDEFEYTAVNGKRYLIIHGDKFDTVILNKKWLAVLGDIGYTILLNVNALLQSLRRLFKIRSHWSLSQHVKNNVKQTVSFITDFEDILANHAKRHEYDGVICGHIHKAEIRNIESVEYLNCGDWVESCTAIAETLDGQFIMIDMLRKKH